MDKKKSEEKIEIHFVDQGMEDQTITVPETMSFQEMKHIYLNQNESQRSKIRLFFDGDRLQDHETPKIVQMENGDTIDVFLEQIGGGKLERDTSKYKEKTKIGFKRKEEKIESKKVQIEQSINHEFLKFDWKKLFSTIVTLSFLFQFGMCNEIEVKESILPSKQILTYNCNEPNNIKKFVLQEDEQCRQQSQNIDDVKETQIEIFQENNMIEVDGYSCEVRRTRTVHQCGSFSHSSVYPEKWWNNKIFHVDPGECNIWIKTGQYRISNYEVCPECQQFTKSQSFPLQNFNGENHFNYFTAGYTYNSGDDLNCEGDRAIFDGQMISQTLIHNFDMVKIRKVGVIIDRNSENDKFIVLDTKQDLKCEQLSSSTYFDDNKRKLGCIFGDEASFVISKPNEVCNLFHVNKMRGSIIQSPYGAKYFTGDKSIVTLSLKKKTIKCNEEVYSTDQNGI